MQQSLGFARFSRRQLLIIGTISLSLSAYFIIRQLAANAAGQPQSILLNSHTQSPGAAAVYSSPVGSSHASVTVNGQNISLPDNGNFSQTVTNSAGTTTINAHTEQNQTGSASHSSTSLSVHSHSASSEDGL